MNKLIILLACLLCWSASAGRLGKNRKLWSLDNLVQTQGGQTYNAGSYYQGQLPSTDERQRILLDVLLQLHKPVVNDEIIQKGQILNTDAPMYKLTNDENLQEFLNLAQNQNILGRNDVFIIDDVQHARQLVGLYKFLVLARDWTIFEQNLCFARIHVNPVMLINALVLTVRDRPDTQDLLVPAINEILPQLFYTRDVIQAAENVDFNQLIGSGNTIGGGGLISNSHRPSLLNLVGLLNPGNLLHAGKSILWQDWRMNMINAGTGAGNRGGRFSSLGGRLGNDVTDKRSILLGGANDKIVVPVDQTLYGSGISTLTDDVDLKIFWNNMMTERLVQTLGGSVGGGVGLGQGFGVGKGFGLGQGSVGLGKGIGMTQGFGQGVGLDSGFRRGQGFGQDVEQGLGLGLRGKSIKGINRGGIFGNIQDDIDVNDITSGLSRKKHWRTIDDGRKVTVNYGDDNDDDDDDEQYMDKHGKKDILKMLKKEQKYLQKDKKQFQKYLNADRDDDDDNVDLDILYGNQHNNLYKRTLGGKSSRARFENLWNTQRNNIYDDVDVDIDDVYGNQKYLKNIGTGYGQFGRGGLGSGGLDRGRIDDYDNDDIFGRSQAGRLGVRDNVLKWGRIIPKDLVNDEQQEQSKNWMYSIVRKPTDGYKIGSNFAQQQQERIMMGPTDRYDQQDTTIKRRIPRSIGAGIGTRMLGDTNKLSTLATATEQLKQQRRGEIFIQNLQQLIARIKMDELALAIETKNLGVGGVNTILLNDNDILEQQQQGKLTLAEIRCVQTVKKVIMELKTIIDQILERNQIDRRSDEVLQVIANLLVEPKTSLGSVWDELKTHVQRTIGGAIGGGIAEGSIKIGITDLSETLHQIMINELVKLIDYYKENLQPYTKMDLAFDDVVIDNVNIDRLVTYTEAVDMDLINLIDQQLLQTNINNLDKLQKKIVARQQRLNHKAFTITYDIKAQRPQPVVIRTLLGPKINKNGRRVTLAENRGDFIVLDAFVEQLQAGNNLVRRNSREITWTTRDVSTLSDIYRGVMTGKFLRNDLVGTNCRYPHHLLLPRGTTDGLPVQILVVVTPLTSADDRNIQQIVDTDRVCGVGIAGLSVDRLPLDFPLDRKIVNEQQLNLPNILLKDDVIQHDDHLRLIRI